MKSLVAIFAVTLLASGCTKPTKPECKAESGYNQTVPHCRKQKPRPKKDCIPVYQDGRLVDCLARDTFHRDMGRGSMFPDTPIR